MDIQSTHESQSDPLPDYLKVWRDILIGADRKSWVLFRNGTVVILMDPKDDLKAQAIDLMKEWGPVHVGSSAGDFSTIRLKKHPGWVVTCHHNDILTYVDESEIPKDNLSDVVVGIHGRGKRDTDAKELDAVHVEDNR